MENIHNQPPKRSKFKIILYSLIPVVALLVVAEAISSMVYYQQRGKSDFAMISVAKRIGNKLRGEKMRVAYEQRYVRLCETNKLIDGYSSPHVEYRRRCDVPLKEQYRYRTDENSFTMPSKVHEKPDLTIAFLGASTTACVYMEEENRFPYQVGRMFEKKTGLKTNSLNGGVSGMTSMSIFGQLVYKIIPMRPDYVVFMEGINDVLIHVYEGAYWNTHPFRSLVVDPNNPRFSAEAAVAYNLDEWRDSREKHIDIDSAAIVANFNRSIESFISMCQIWDIDAVLMTQESRFTDIPEPKIWSVTIEEWKKNDIEYSTIKHLHEAFNDCIRQAAKRHGLLLVDLAKEVPQTKEYMHDPVHFTDKGSIFAAELISNELVKYHQGKHDDISPK